MEQPDLALSGCAPDVALVTAAQMPAEDTESGLLVAALADLGLDAQLVVWDAPRDWAASPLVVLRTPWDYHERHEEFLAWARATAAATTLVNPVAVVEWNHHKRYLADLAGRGLPVVPLALVARGADRGAQDRALRRFGDEVVVKPAISGGAYRTIRAPAASPEAREHLAGLVRDGDALVQPYLRAIEDGEVSLVCLGGELSHAVLKRAATGDFRVQSEHGGSVQPHRATTAERALADAVLHAAGATSYARIDVVTTADGPLLMEVELIDPELFLPMHPDAAARLARVLRDLLPATR